MRLRAGSWLVLVVAMGAAALVVGIRGQGGRTGAETTLPADGPAEIPHVLVLNGAGRAGLAREISLLLGPAGCVAAGVGNAEGPVRTTSVLVNRRLAEEQAGQLARRLGGLTVLREWDPRMTEDAVLVLGTDWEQVRTALGQAVVGSGDPAN